jgi:hypothetical protein
MTDGQGDESQGSGGLHAEMRMPAGSKLLVEKVWQRQGRGSYVNVARKPL